VVQLVAEQLLRVCLSMAGLAPARAAKKAAKGAMAVAGAAVAAPVSAAPAAAPEPAHAGGGWLKLQFS
jgi:hypothetical protein